MTMASDMRDADDNVVTSAAPLGLPRRFDPEKTWDGSDDADEIRALRIEIESANLVVENLRRDLDAQTQESIATRKALEDSEAKRVDVEAKLRRAEAAELLYENVLDRCADYLSGADPVLAIPSAEVDRAKRAGVSTQYAEGYHRRIMAALVAAKDADSRARAGVQQGLAGVSDEDFFTELLRRCPTLSGIEFDDDSGSTVESAILRHGGLWHVKDGLRLDSCEESLAEAVAVAKRLAGAC